MMPPPPPPPLDPHHMEANGRYPPKPPAPPGFMVIMNTINAITQIMIGGVAFTAFSFANMFNVSSGYTQHIYLCVIGYVILMSQAILSFNPHAGWAYGLSYPVKKFTHIGMQIIGSTFAIAGSLIRILDMDVHFNTAHGIVGIIALILTILSLIGGVLNIIYCQRDGGVKILKIIHSCLGSITITVAFICLCLGFSHDHYTIVLGEINSNIAIAITTLALFGLLISSVTNIFKKILF